MVFRGLLENRTEPVVGAGPRLQVRIGAGSGTQVSLLGIEQEAVSYLEAVTIPELSYKGRTIQKVVVEPHSPPSPPRLKCPG